MCKCWPPMLTSLGLISSLTQAHATWLLVKSLSNSQTSSWIKKKEDQLKHPPSKTGSHKDRNTHTDKQTKPEGTWQSHQEALQGLLWVKEWSSSFLHRSAPQRTLSVSGLPLFIWLVTRSSSLAILTLRWSHVRVRVEVRHSNVFRGDWLWSLAPPYTLPPRLAYWLLCVASWDPRQVLLWRQHSSAWLWQVATVVQSGISNSTWVSSGTFWIISLGLFSLDSIFSYRLHCFGASALHFRESWNHLSMN